MTEKKKNKYVRTILNLNTTNSAGTVLLILTSGSTTAQTIISASLNTSLQMPLLVILQEN
jgi:hypothetical protein